VITVQSTAYFTSTPFTATATTSAGGNWLLVTPAKGATPASVTVSLSLAGLAPGTYSGQVNIQGPANSASFPVTITISPPLALSFVLEVATATPQNSPQRLSFFQGLISTFSVQTESGGNWLAALHFPQPGYDDELWVSANASGLAPGTYQGTITITGTFPNGSVHVPVSLTVLPQPSGPLTVTPASLSLTAAAGQTATQSFTVNSSAGVTLFGLTASVYPVTAPGGGVNPQASLTATATSFAASSTPSYIGSNPVGTNPSVAPVAPAVYQIQASAAEPGTYYGNITINWDGGFLVTPITLSVTATPALAPVMAAVVNAASQTAAAMAPGEIVSIFGMGVGSAPATFTPDAAGKLPTTLGGTQVVIDGAPAPLLYVSAGQINAIVPYEAGDSGTATIQVLSNGVPSAIWGLPVAPAAAAIFTSGGGIGQAAVLNQDNSPNSATNPAALGSVVQIYATGGGQTTPASITGTIAGGSPNPTVLPVTATIGGADAPVTYHGSAPGEVTGLLQVNAVVPSASPPGPAVPILINVGGGQSQSGVTVAIK
jgi:uncharacterized protein (TIGR03437 family)